MANFLLVYKGGSQPQSEEEGAAVMKAWTDWFMGLGEAVVDAGNPVSQTRVVSPDGSVSDGGAHSPTGYSVLRADGMAAAVELARGCPHLAVGGTIDVAETFEVM